MDIIAVLTESENPHTYCRVLKKRLKDEGNETITICNALKMKASDGKVRLTDVLKTSDVQSIPSPKAETFKMWLAQVGSERLDEIADPEKAMQRGADFYRMKGYPAEWITQRLLSIKIRKELTDEWKTRGIESEQDYAILTTPRVRFLDLRRIA